MIAHPRHAGELGSVGQFVEQHPGAELVRVEAEALLERRQVRARPCTPRRRRRRDRPAGRTGRARGCSSSRAARRARRRPLCRPMLADRAASSGSSPTIPPSTGSSRCWNEAMLARIQAGRSMTLDRGRAGQRAQTGGRLDLVLQLRDHRRQVELAAASAVGGWRAAIRVATCSARRQSIGDSAAATSRPVTLRGSRLDGVLRCGDLLQVAADQADDRQDRDGKQDDAEPVVEDDRCHAGQRSEHPSNP